MTRHRSTPKLRARSRASAWPAIAALFGTVLLGLALSGCGGSSDSSSGASGSSGSGGSVHTYSLSGLVSGLTSDGLMLDVNGSTTKTPSGSTSVNLASGLSSGTAYTISVASQPTGETCTVTNGSGTVGASDVTNIAVTCTDNAYTLSGSISGLTQSGLVLANGSDTVAVAANASTFVMPSKIAYGSSYGVTVQTQPLEETCAVSQGSGTTPAGAVNSVAVTCSANAYSIGGSIVGLGASGLVLLDNSTDTTKIAANATQFTMNTGLAYGSGYVITIEIQPAGEICTIGNGSGTVSGDVTDVNIGCAPLLHEFAGGSGDGATPLGSLIQASDGNLYGTTQVGGASGAGTIFKLTPDGSETVLHSFADSPDDGARPEGSLIEGSDGNLYGTTFNGGVGGAVFKISLAGAESLLSSFGGADDGTDPVGLIQASDGNFYGTAFNGGTYSYGTLFKLTPSGALTVLHAFTGSSGDGANPYTLIQASDGNLYGITNYGGADGYGTVFKMTLTGAETVLYSFSDAGDGAYPGSLIEGSDGNLYGTTYGDRGSPQGHGTIFQITPTGTLTTLHTYNGGAGGGNPLDLIQARDGNFYGTTYIGGIYNGGTVFRLTPEGAYAVLDSFSGGDDGAGAQALIQGSNGNLFGSTVFGGVAASPNGYGTIFEIIPP